jgi:hypothetical protein
MSTCIWWQRHGEAVKVLALLAVASTSCVDPRTDGDSDVCKSELSVFVSVKNVNMDIRIRIVFNMFNMDVRWMYSNPISMLSAFDIIRNIRQKSDISDIIRIRKN